jgi:hypothetical protein
LALEVAIGGRTRRLWRARLRVVRGSRRWDMAKGLSVDDGRT